MNGPLVDSHMYTELCGNKALAPHSNDGLWIIFFSSIGPVKHHLYFFFFFKPDLGTNDYLYILFAVNHQKHSSI